MLLTSAIKLPTVSRTEDAGCKSRALEFCFVLMTLAYLVERKSYRQGGTEKAFHSLIRSLNGQSGWG